MKKVIPIFLLVLATVFLSACSSIQSVAVDNAAKKESEKKSEDGLVYYMPKKDVLITIKNENENEKDKPKTITIGMTEVYPDLDKPYVLKHGFNLVGKNTSDVMINEKGLLSSAKSTTISNGRRDNSGCCRNHWLIYFSGKNNRERTTGLSHWRKHLHY